MDRVMVFDTALRLCEKGIQVVGRGASTDIIEASARGTSTV